jgi:hypothetical protein
MNPRINIAIPNDDFTIQVVFNNGESGIFDVNQFLDKGSFKELQDLSNFRRFHLEDGVITWYNDLDLSPDTVYLLSKKQ